MDTTVIDNLARELIAHFQMKREDLAPPSKAIENGRFGQVRQLLEHHSAGTLGEVAVCGRGHADDSGTTLYEVHYEDWLPQRASGRFLLEILATTAVIARMHDMLEEAALRAEIEAAG